MSKSKWVIGISLGVIVLVMTMLFIGVIPIPESNSSSMEIIFYDADGNELGKAEPTLGIRSADFTGDVYSLDVVVYFKITTDANYAQLSSRCDLSVETLVNTYQGSVVHTVAEHRLGAINVDLEGTFYATYLMSTLLPDSKIDELGKENGWTMIFKAKVTSQVVIADADNINVEDTCGTTLALSWDEGTATVDSWFGNW